MTALSAKYDVKNNDESWVCVFCRKSTHYCGLGDLFGPYHIPSDQWKSLNLPTVDKPSKDIVSSFIKGGSDQAGAKAKKKLAQKKKSVTGNTESPSKSSPIKSDQKSEIWFHEDCVCWLPQIRLMGNRILGLPEAIRVSQKTACSKCNHKGCTIACSKVRCHETVHYPCAQALHWEIDDDNFSARCQKCVI